jgi:hypothetical protein
MEVNMAAPALQRGLKYGCWHEWKKNTMSNTDEKFEDKLQKVWKKSSCREGVMAHKLNVFSMSGGEGINCVHKYRA